jgi:hypothetical protein
MVADGDGVTGAYWEKEKTFFFLSLYRLFFRLPILILGN